MMALEKGKFKVATFLANTGKVRLANAPGGTHNTRECVRWL